MIRFNLLQCVVILFQCFYLTNCHKKYSSLIVTEQYGEFILTKPTIYDHNRSHFLAPSTGHTYNLCPTSERIENPIIKAETLHNRLLTIRRRVRKKETTSDRGKCKFLIETVLMKVNRPADFKHNWRQGMDLYHSGFLVQRNMKQNNSISSEKLCKILSCNEDPMRKYKYLSDDYDVILGIEIHFDREIKQTVAVEYTLISTSVKGFPALDDFWFERVSPEGIIPPFKKYIEGDNDKKFIESIVGASWKNYFYQKRPHNMIRAIPLAPPEHFKLLTWKLPTMIWANQIPVWYHVTQQWNKVIKFSRIVAQYIGDLKVSIGITGTMFLPDARKQNTFLNEDAIPLVSVHFPKTLEQSPEDKKEILANVNEGHKNIPQVLLIDKETKFKMPNYLWAALEFQDGKNSYGIFVIMHCNPFFDNTKVICEDICRPNGFYTLSNPDFDEGKTYCCEMTPENITKLEANFLHKRYVQREIFDLHNWQKINARMKIILKYYEEKNK